MFDGSRGEKGRRGEGEKGRWGEPGDGVARVKEESLGRIKRAKEEKQQSSVQREIKIKRKNGENKRSMAQNVPSFRERELVFSGTQPSDTHEEPRHLIKDEFSNTGASQPPFDPAPRGSGPLQLA